MENNETVLLVYKKKNKYPILKHIFNVQWVKSKRFPRTQNYGYGITTDFNGPLKFTCLLFSFSGKDSCFEDL